MGPATTRLVSDVDDSRTRRHLSASHHWVMQTVADFASKSSPNACTTTLVAIDGQQLRRARRRSSTATRSSGDISRQPVSSAIVLPQPRHDSFLASSVHRLTHGDGTEPDRHSGQSTRSANAMAALMPVTSRASPSATWLPGSPQRTQDNSAVTANLSGTLGSLGTQAVRTKPRLPPAGAKQQTTQSTSVSSRSPWSRHQAGTAPCEPCASIANRSGLQTLMARPQKNISDRANVWCLTATGHSTESPAWQPRSVEAARPTQVPSQARSAHC